MISFINKFKIPTILGLAVIFAGITAGVFLSLQDQKFFAKASPALAPQNITLSNISDAEVTISWQTPAPTTSFVTFGIKSPGEETVLDARDSGVPKEYSLHYVTLKNLEPESSYLFKIISGKFQSETQEFKTAKSLSSQNGFGPIIGTVLDGDKPLNEGIVYFSISGASIQSALIKNMGNFLIPISLARSTDLSDISRPKDDDVAKLTITSESGEASVLFKIKSQGVELPSVKLGQNIDLTIIDLTIEEELSKFDMNGDSYVNTVDYSIVLQNFGLQNRQADFNKDGVVDNIDLEEISKKIERQD